MSITLWGSAALAYAYWHVFCAVHMTSTDMRVIYRPPIAGDHRVTSCANIWP